MSKARLPDFSQVFAHAAEVAQSHLPTLPDLSGEAEAAAPELPSHGAEHLPELTHVSGHALPHLPEFLV